MGEAAGTSHTTSLMGPSRLIGGALQCVLGAAALTLGWSASTVAHHGITAQFDTSTTFGISGVVTDLEFVNPHAYVYFDVTSPEGDLVPWRCELRAATVLRRSGHSIGRWEGDELVVETTGFAPGYLETRDAVMHGSEMDVVERFSYDHEGRTLTRSWIAEDPTYFTCSYTGQDTVEIADIPYEPYDCTDLTNEHIAESA